MHGRDSGYWTGGGHSKEGAGPEEGGRPRTCSRSGTKCGRGRVAPPEPTETAPAASAPTPAAPPAGAVAPAAPVASTPAPTGAPAPAAPPAPVPPAAPPAPVPPAPTAAPAPAQSVSQATEAALGGVQATTLLSSAVADAQDVGTGTSTPRPLTPCVPLTKLVWRWGLTRARLVLESPLPSSASTSSTSAAAASAASTPTTTATAASTSTAATVIV
ncbi:unnamed protein product [Closterium sp. NIES-53]